MKRYLRFGIPALACAAGLFVGVAVAQEGGAPGMATPAWMAKGKEHESLKKYVGTWDAAVNGMPGKATNALVLGDCFLEQKFEMTIPGMGAFEGRMITGYDTIDKEWVAIWIDSSKPIFGISRGTEKDGVITFKTNDPSMTDPSGKRVPGKMVLSWVNDASYKLTMFEGEAQTMEVVYTKAK
jgi:hypothetical protein